MSTVDERNVDPIQEMTRLAASFLHLAQWGFKESFHSAKLRSLIYDSEWCRLNLILGWVGLSWW